MKTGYLLLLVAVTIMVSGCAEAGDGKTPELKGNEIVILENVEAVPNDVKPERNFILSGFVTNKATTKINNVKIVLADYCSSVFDVVKTSCSLTSFDGYSDCVFSLNLDASNKFQWNFKAPPATRTAGRDFDCNMVVKTNYSYTAHGSVGVALANDAEITMREAGPTPVTGDGPLKIYITVESSQPIGRSEMFDVKVVLRNEGEGEIEGGGVLNSSLKIGIPSGITYNCYRPDALIEISKTKKESAPIFCALKTPEILPPRVTKFITAEVDYSYKFSSAVPVKLSVMKQV